MISHNSDNYTILIEVEIKLEKLDLKRENLNPIFTLVLIDTLGGESSRE